LRVVSWSISEEKYLQKKNRAEGMGSWMAMRQPAAAPFVKNED
jgi:hypothetical protein